MLKMMYSYKTAEGRGAERHLRVKTADGCKAGWTCAKHAPQRGEDSMGRVRINYRYYNPTDGRWTRRDPLGMENGKNLFKFCYNIPVLFIDNLGEKLNNPPPRSIPPANRPQPILKGTPKAKAVKVPRGNEGGSPTLETLEFELALLEVFSPSRVVAFHKGRRICNKEKAANPKQSANSCGCCIIVIADFAHHYGNAPYAAASVAQVKYVYNTTCSKYNENENSLFDETILFRRNLFDYERIFEVIPVTV